MFLTRRQRYEATKLLLENRALPDVQDNDGNSPLYKASEKGFSDIEDLLLKYGASPLDDQLLRKKQEVQNTNLLYVCNPEGKEDVDMKIIQKLLNAGADINAREREGWTCLMHTARTGRYEAAKLLIENKANVNIVKKMIDKKMSLFNALEATSKESSDMIGYTALNLASRFGHFDVVRLLLESGADPNLTGRDGYSPLEFAVGRGNVEIENILLSHGAFPLNSHQLKRAQKAKNRNLLAACSEQNCDLGDVERLLHAGADINTTSTEDSDTAVNLAAKSANQNLVSFLLENGANPDIRNAEHKAALEIALEQGHTKVTNLLIAHRSLQQSMSHLENNEEVNDVRQNLRKKNLTSLAIFLNYQQILDIKNTSLIYSLFLDKDPEAICNLFQFIREYRKIPKYQRGMERFLRPGNSPFYLVESERLQGNDKTQVSLLGYIINKGSKEVILICKNDFV